MSLSPERRSEIVYLLMRLEDAETGSDVLDREFMEAMDMPSRQVSHLQTTQVINDTWQWLPFKYGGGKYSSCRFETRVISDWIPDPTQSPALDLDCPVGRVDKATILPKRRGYVATIWKRNNWFRRRLIGYGIGRTPALAAAIAVLGRALEVERLN